MKFHFTVGKYNPILHECNRFLFLGQEKEMKKVLSLLFLLFALNSVCVAEIMEDYRIACKNTDGKNLCKAVLTSDKNAIIYQFHGNT
jgi:hypothetical protein